MGIKGVLMYLLQKQDIVQQCEVYHTGRNVCHANYLLGSTTQAAALSPEQFCEHVLQTLAFHTN